MPVDSSFIQNFLAGAQQAREEQMAQMAAEEHKLNVQQKKLELDTAKLNQAKQQREIQAMTSGGPMTQPAPSVPDVITPAPADQSLPQSMQDILTRIHQQPVVAQQMPINPLPGPNIPVQLSTGMVTIPGTNREMQTAEANQAAQAALQAEIAKAGGIANAQEQAKAPFTFHEMTPGAQGVIGAGTPGQTIVGGPPAKQAGVDQQVLDAYLAANPGKTAYDFEIAKAAAMRAQTPVPGRDVPLSPEVEAQRLRISRAGASALDTGDAKAIAGAIMDGSQPPLLTGLYRNAAPVRAELARNGYDLSTATRDWQAIQKHLATLNGAQQERLRQAISFTHDSLNIIEDLYQQWKEAAGVSGYKVLNKGTLAAMKQLPGEKGAIAQSLESQINDLTAELATVYKGGNASTDEGLRLAAENLKADWNETTFDQAIEQIRKNLTIRKNSILTSQPVGVTPNSPYNPPTPDLTPPANPSAGTKPKTITMPGGRVLTLGTDGLYHGTK